MLTVGGLVFLLLCVFGSYIVSGGSLGPLVEALPFEMWTIGGAAVGTCVMANSINDLKHLGGAMVKMLKGAAFRKGDYVDLLSLLFHLTKLASNKGVVAIEAHVEQPAESEIFQKFPKVLKNHHALTMICDYLRMFTMNADDPNQIEDLIMRELKKTLAEELHPSHMMQTMADALPALGIVAAVLGVVKTMSHIDQPPAVLGAMIGGALVGTFLGVLLAYGIAGPFSNRMRGVVEEEAKYLEVIRAVLVSHLHGNAPPVSVETGRKMVPSQHMPTFLELEEATDAIKV
ncbi:MAG TPA: flagellar motor stator protein MotA [Rhodopila sp.]|uniref:flagellar motor stator protein MotA n=1 Tax=Rhodopila sp. TaxID=2480087 RepID=UPI002C422E43|nr:flagellar motor stator protein MotA [Rhodopila sp.]HVY16476.1 flagellar motor stator protein MotA [Rhodopila sp.]